MSARTFATLVLTVVLVSLLLTSSLLLSVNAQETPHTPRPATGGSGLLFLPALGRPDAATSRTQARAALVDRRVTVWADPMKLSIKTIAERPDVTAGDVEYVIKDLFTTHNGSWDVTGETYGVPQWAKDAYLNGAFVKATEKNNLFAAVIGLDGQFVQDQEFVYWTGGLGKLTDLGSTTWVVRNTVEQPGWASMVLYTSSSYDPPSVAGPWCYTPNKPLPAEGLCGGGLPYGELVSTFVVWQAVPRGSTPTPTGTPTPAPTGPTVTPPPPQPETPTPTPTPPGVLTPAPAVQRRTGTWVDEFNLYTKTVAERPGTVPGGDYTYLIKDIFTTRDGSWEPSSVYGSVDHWARDAYLKPIGDPEYFDDAGADHHLFAAILDPNGHLLKNLDMLYWSDGFTMLGDPNFDSYVMGSNGYRYPRTKDKSGWANIVLDPGSNYSPERGESGPWCWTPVGLRSEVMCGGGMPLKQHISIFVVWQAVPNSNPGTPTPTPTPTATPRPLTIVQVDPNQSIGSVPNEVRIVGTNLQPGMQVAIAGVALQGVTVDQANATDASAIVPAGIGPGRYDVVAHNPNQPAFTLPAGYSVIDANGVDLAATDTDLWFDPVLVRQGRQTMLGLNVHRSGGSALLAVTVGFYLGSPGTGTLLGEATTLPLNPGNNVVDGATLVWTPPAAGTYAIYAVVDPANTVGETSESNNMARASVRVLPAATETTDIMPPNVNFFTVNGGAQTTIVPTITVALAATDNGGGSEVASMYLVERIYSNSARQWVTRQQTGWIPYNSNFSMLLSPAGGARYLQVWVADAAGNVSSTATRALVNYLRPSDSVLAAQVHVYRLQLAAGQTMQAGLTVSAGDADLYVWDAAGNLVDYSNNAVTTADAVTVAAAQSGLYQIEVHGYEDSIYHLELGTAAGVAAAANHAPNAKNLPPAPVVAATNVPPEQQALPAAPNSRLYFPIMGR